LNELLRAIVDDPDDVDAYLVYADWLQARGDPRGELVAVQVALERSPDAELLAREAALLEQHGVDWGVPADATVVWRYGFVRALEFGDWSPHHEPGEWEASLGDLSTLWTAQPLLHSVVLTGEVKSFGVIDAPKLSRFEWRTFGPEPGWRASCDANMSAITNAKWPQLETLDLWFARGDGYDSKRLPWMRKILAGTGLGTLKHLALRAFALWPEPLRSELEHAKILPQLATLDLSAAIPVDESDLRRLRDRPAFRHLQSFEI